VAAREGVHRDADVFERVRGQPAFLTRFHRMFLSTLTFDIMPGSMMRLPRSVHVLGVVTATVACRPFGVEQGYGMS
jgi:hypothetical protein